MGYVFNEIFWWVLAALVVGFALGWFYWKCRVWFGNTDEHERQLDELRAQVSTHETRATDLSGELETRNAAFMSLESDVSAKDEELESLRMRVRDLEGASVDADGLRARIGELEPLEAEAASLRTRVGELENVEADAAGLRTRLADLEPLEGEVAGLRSRVGELEAANAEIAGLRARIAELEGASADADGLRARVGELERANAEIEGLRARIAELEGIEADADGLRARITELETAATATAAAGGTAAAVGFMSDTNTETHADTPSLDLDAARTVLGKRIKMDDLTVVEGIGPQISGLLNDDGIDTWHRLSDTDPTHIKGILDAAGPRFQMHDPGTWPEQAGLLADGRWEEFKALTDELDGGVRVTGTSSSFADMGAEAATPVIDLTEGSAFLGTTISMDDLKVVEGIGPKIEELMHQAGITTWSRLSQTDPAVLSSILEGAGPRFRIHDPGTWPEQAGLLVNGRWEQFKDLTDRLRGGREN